VFINRTGILGLVMLCGAAGAGGAYLANRGDADPSAVTMAAAPATMVDATPLVAPVATPAEAAQARNPSRAPAGFRAAQSPPVGTARTVERRTSVAPADRRTGASDSPRTEPSPVASNNVSSPVITPVVAPIRVAEPVFEEVTVAADTVLGLQMGETISSEDARVEDQVTALVTREVRVGDRVAIPSGAKAYGEVTLVERGGRLRDRARVGIRFSSLQLTDGSRVPIETDVILRDGDSASRESAAKIGGGAIGGAIIGGILGGGKGAVLGGSVGAGAGSAAVLAGGRNAAVLAEGAPVTVRLTQPVVITLDR
jgi:hypothetical protein